MLSQIAIDINEFFYGDLPTKTLADRIKKAKLIKGITQKELALKSGLSLPAVCELEAGYRDNITRDTLLKLLKVLDKDIICDDYLLFVLEQGHYINEAILKYGITYLCKYLKCHHKTIYGWRDSKHKISKEKYYIFKELIK